MNIDVTEEYISREFLKGCIDHYDRLIKNSQSQRLDIVAKVKIKEIDILVVAYFVLFIQQTPGLKIVLHLAHNGGDINLRGKLRQYMAYAYLATGKNVFEADFGDSNAALDRIDSAGFVGQKKSWVVISEKFIPIIGVTEESYSIFFEKIVDGLDGLPDDVEYDKKGESLYNNCIHAINERGNLVDVSEVITFLASTAFYKSLYEAKVISIYLDDRYVREKRKIHGIRAQNLQGDEAYRYYEEVKEIFADLSKKPPIYQFIFCTLLLSKLLPPTLKKDTIKAYITGLLNLWRFTKELVYGLQELAKNIIEHSSEKRGVITARVYNQTTWEELKDLDVSEIEVVKTLIIPNSVESGSGEISLLDINVVDDGKSGVIETLLSSTEEYVPGEDIDYGPISGDIALLRSGNVTFRSIVDPSEGSLLNQQAKRATAHLGLLAFAKLIESNGGVIRASTWKYPTKDGGRDSVYVPSILSEKETSKGPLALGTNYHVIMPIIPLRPYRPYLYRSMEAPEESAAMEIKSIEDMFSFVTMTKREEYENSLEKESSVLYSITPGRTILTGRERESTLWFQYFGKYSNTHLDINNDVVYAVNMENVTINSSQLFRLLGKWELERPNQPVIIYNIEADVLVSLLKLNEAYVERAAGRLPYWGEDNISIIYSYTLIENNRFYFADGLWGREEKDFIGLNSLIRRTNMNVTTLLNVGKSRDDSDEKYIVNVRQLTKYRLFHDVKTLLPFDLLLRCEDGKTLFEKNAEILLRNELIFNRNEA